jgi:hypothetical protein
MRNYRKVVATLVLALTLSMSAFAGEIHTNVTSPTPTPAANGEMHTGVTNGEIQTGEAVSTPEATDIMTEAALNLLQSLLTLF